MGLCIGSEVDVAAGCFFSAAFGFAEETGLEGGSARAEHRRAKIRKIVLHEQFNGVRKSGRGCMVWKADVVAAFGGENGVAEEADPAVYDGLA
jgi:hypothetical protein